MHNLYSEICRSRLQKTACVFGDHEYTYRDFLGEIEAFSEALGQQGVACGDRVGLTSYDNFRLLVAIYACAKLGAVAVPLPFDSRERMEGARRAAAIKSTWAEYPELGRKDFSSQYVTFDEALVIFTSGTTSSSLKGVRLSHRAISSTARFMNTAMEVDDSIVECVHASIDHAFGFVRCHAVLAIGGTLVLSGILTFGRLFESLENFRCNALATAPSILSTLLKVSRERLASFAGQIRWIQAGAMRFDSHYRVQLCSALPKTRIFIHYGLSEALRATFFELNRNLDKVHTEGPAASGMQIRILDEQHRELPRNVEGIIAVKGEHLFSGYLSADAPFDSEGWFITSDRGWLDGEGFLNFAGRNDDVINYNGKLIHPDEIETKLVSLFGNANYSVVGMADPSRLKDAIVVLFVESSCEVTLQDVVRHLSSEDNVMIPSRIISVDRLPRTRSGKVNRVELRKLVA